MKKQDLLKLNMRRDIFQFVLKYPGLHLRELSREMKLPYSTLEYHVNYLRKRELIVAKSEGKYQRFYVKGEVSNGEKDMMQLIRKDTPQKIVLLLLFTTCSSRKELSDNLEKHPTTIEFHLKKLMELGVVEEARVGEEGIYTNYRVTKIVAKKPMNNEKFYLLKDPYYIYDLFITYKEKLLDDGLVGSILELFEFTWPSEPKKVQTDNDEEKFLKNITDIFPHPYHV